MGKSIVSTGVDPLRAICGVNGLKPLFEAYNQDNFLYYSAEYYYLIQISFIVHLLLIFIAKGCLPYFPVFVQEVP